MPDVKISEMTEATSLAATDQFEIAQDAGGGTFNTRRVSVATLADEIGGGGGGSPLGLWDVWHEVRVYTVMASNSSFFAPTSFAGGISFNGVPTVSTNGFTRYGVYIQKGTTANGGVRYLSTSLNTNWFGSISHKFRGQFMWRDSFTGRMVRMGYLDTTDHNDSTDGAYFEIDGSTCRAKTANNSARTTNATTVTLSVNTPYTFDIDVNAAGTEARFRVWEGQTTTAIMDVTNTTNIPTTEARAFGTGIVASESSTSNANIGVLYLLGEGTIEGFQRARG